MLAPWDDAERGDPAEALRRGADRVASMIVTSTSSDLDCALASYEAYLTTVAEDAEASMWIADLQNRMSR